MERYNLAVLRQEGDRAGLSHVHRIAPHLQPCRDDIVELDQHADLTVQCDSQHPVEVPIGDQEATTVGLQRVLESGRDVERSGRRIGQVELANVCNDREAVWAVYSVNAVNIAAADVGADEGDQCISDVVDERDVDRPTDERPTDANDGRRQATGERCRLASLRIDARDPAGYAFRDVKRTIGADGAALGTLHSAIQSRS
jgi:hypothetical protein